MGQLQAGQDQPQRVVDDRLLLHRVPLVAIYPKEGTLYSDNPWVVLDAEWSTPAKQAAAKDFFEFLRTATSQERFTDAGFRTWDGKAGSPIRESDNLIEDGVKITLSPPSPAVLDAARSAWSELRKAARVLLLLDVSGSMDEGVEAAGTTRMELAKSGLLRSLDLFEARDEVGVWAFTTELDTPSGITEELVPVGPIGNGATVRKAVKELAPLQGTPLYASIKVALEAMRASYDSSKINAIVVLTDGRNEYPADNNLQGLVRRLENQSSETPLRVFSIAYSTGADLDVLKQISEASEAAAYDATDPESIDKVMTAVISNF